MTGKSLKELANQLDADVTNIEGAASALAGLNSEEVPHEVGAGRSWLAGEIHGLVSNLRKLTDEIFKATRDGEAAS